METLDIVSDWIEAVINMAINPNESFRQDASQVNQCLYLLFTKEGRITLESDATFLIRRHYLYFKYTKLVQC